MMFWWLFACPKREIDAAARRDELLALADQAWEQRGELGFEQASQPLLEAYGLSPTAPSVLWRIARLKTAEGMVADQPSVARSSFAEARSTGAACLEALPGFVERRRAEGWAGALAELTPDRLPCVAWTAFPWVRWMELQGGDAAALDLEPIEALLDRLEGPVAPDIERIAIWARGLLLAVRPTWAGRDLQAAREDLERAVKLNRRELPPLVDLYLVIHEIGTPEEQSVLRRRILAEPAITPEDLRARAKLAD